MEKTLAFVLHEKEFCNSKKVYGGEKNKCKDYTWLVFKEITSFKGATISFWFYRGGGVARMKFQKKKAGQEFWVIKTGWMTIYVKKKSRTEWSKK